MENSVKTNFGITLIILIFVMILRTNILANSYELANIKNVKTILEYKELTSIDDMDTVKFGSTKYKEMDWIVLEKNEDRALLFSNDIEFQYNFSINAGNDNKEIKWSNSALRKCLNTEIFDKYFTNDEKMLIIKTEVNTNLKSGTETSNDNLFLLSQEEVERYFRWKDSRRIKDVGKTSWWLRDQGKTKTSAKFVDAYGDFSSKSAKYGNYCGVRFAMWVKCDAGISGSQDENKSIVDNIVSNVNSDFRTQVINAKIISAFDENTTIDKVSGVFYGSYPQNAVSGNTKEPIEWIVLEKKDNEVLLLSKYVLDGKKYNESSEKVNWESCSLRNWLNTTFYNEAFDNNEKNNVIDSQVEFGAGSNNVVTDRVFILSYKELREYFKQTNMHKPNKKLATAATDYAIKNGAVSIYKNDSWNLGNCCYWILEKNVSKLIEKNGLYKKVEYVDKYGAIPETKINIEHEKFGVRPAMWVRY